MKRGKRSLRIEINDQDTVSRQGKMLPEVRGSSGFSRAALEVYDGNDL